VSGRGDQVGELVDELVQGLLDEQVTPPKTNRGVLGTQPLTVSFGWVQGTTHAAWADVLGLLEPVYGKARPHGDVNRFYGECWVLGPYGVKLSLYPIEYEGADEAAESREGEMLIVIPQAALDAAGFEADAEVTRRLLVMGFRATRVDAYLDDRRPDGVRLEPRQLQAAREAGQCRTRMSSGDFHVSDKEIRVPRADGTVTRLQVHSETFYAGSRQSSALVRVYDKRAESLVNRGEEIGACTRVEIEAHRQKESNLAELLLSTLVGGAPGAELIQVLVGLLDFHDCPPGGQHKERYPRLPWWESLVGAARQVRVEWRRHAPTVESTLRWYHVQVKKSLAFLREAYGRSYPHAGSGGFVRWLEATLNGAERRLRRDPYRLELLERIEPGESDLFPWPRGERRWRPAAVG